MPTLIYPVGSTKACLYAAAALNTAGISLVDHPTPEVTHLLLDAPSFGPEGKLRGGEDFSGILERLPASITVIGGNLKHPSLTGYQVIDLLKNPEYLAMNAAITAECALQTAAKEMKITFFGCPVLIVGWGRIGKCLGKLLNALGAEVTIAARKEADRAMLKALGYRTVPPEGLLPLMPRFRLIFNTAPEMVLEEPMTSACQDCVKIDLASKPGIQGSDVIWARGLPGVCVPESSGTLMARTILNQLGRY